MWVDPFHIMKFNSHSDKSIYKLHLYYKSYVDRSIEITIAIELTRTRELISYYITYHNINIEILII